MPAHEFLTNITLILAVMGIGALLETAVPMFAAEARKPDRRTANLGLTALTFVSNWLLASLAAAAALALQPSRAVAETNSNYANVLTLYDRLLGTYTPAERAASVVYGLDDVDPVAVASFPALLSMPFHTSAASEVPDTKVRIEGAIGQ